MKKKILSLMIFSLVAVMSYNTIITKAYTMSYGMPTNRFKIKNYFSNQWYASKFSVSMANWSLGGYAYISEDFGAETDTTNCICDEYDNTTTEYGYYSPIDVDENKIIESFVIVINQYNVPTGSTSNASNVATSVITHEIGHALHLDDIKSFWQSHKYDSIMSYYIDRATIYKPQPYDYSEVDRVY